LLHAKRAIGTCSIALDIKKLKVARPKIQKIVSGGQTGADRAGLDWAIAQGLEHQGWCPAGRRAEDGEIPREYSLRETDSSNYLVRTRWNVRDSDGTVIFTLSDHLSGGSLATQRFASALGRPCLHVARDGRYDAVEVLLEFLEEFDVKILNIAGPRRSNEPDVGEFIWQVMDGLIGAE
jgi:hypothetical protein